MNGKLHLESWAGRTVVPVEIIRETPKRYRVRLLRDCIRGKAGAELLVPRYAVTFDEGGTDDTSQ